MSEDNRAAAALLLQEAWSNLSQGHQKIAREQALRAVKLDPQSEGPWLVLAALGTPEESLEYLQKVLEINPGNRRAIQGLQWARGRVKAKNEAAVSNAGPPPTPAIPQPPLENERLHPESTAVIEPALFNELEQELISKGYSSPFLDQTRPVSIKPPPPPVPPAPENAKPAVSPKSEPPAAPVKKKKKKTPDKPAVSLSRGKVAAFIASGFFICLFLSAAVMIPFSKLFFPSLVSANSSSSLVQAFNASPATAAPEVTARDVESAALNPEEVESQESQQDLRTLVPIPSITYAPSFTPVFTSTPVFTNTPPPTVEAIPVESQQSDMQTANYGFSGRWIDVDLQNQKAYAYEDDEIVKEFIISSGIAAYPTVTGQFHIYLKYRYDDMAGPGYYLRDVPYVMYFYKGYGLHGTYWHHNFGTPMSHGCVNMITEDAAWLYDFAPMGTLVNIH